MHTTRTTLFLAITLSALVPAYPEPEKVIAKVWPSPDGVVELRKALDAVRANNKDMQEDIVVELGDGTIYSYDTVIIGAEHSGSNGHYVVFRAAQGAKPILSRGRAVMNWEAESDGRWTARLGGRDVRQFFVNNVRAQRARGSFPENAERYGDLRVVDGDAGFIVQDPSMAKWGYSHEVIIGFLNSWSHMTCNGQLHEPDADGRVRIRLYQPVFSLISRKEGVRAEKPAYIENVLGVLDEPGEWYVSKGEDTIYYMPRSEEDMKTATTVTTGDGSLLSVVGRERTIAHHIKFEGITFAEGASYYPDFSGLADVQANFAITTDNSYERDGYLVNLHNEYVKPQAAVTVNAAHDIVFDRCTFTRIGGAALNIEAGNRINHYAAHKITIQTCRFLDIGGSAIQVGDVHRYAHHPEYDEQIVRNVHILDCTIQKVGAEYEGSVGIFAGYVQNTEIVGNEIHNLPYSGISIGWGWGEEDAGGSTYAIPFIYESPTPARDNRIANNHIHHVMQKRLDGGGIYTLGNMPGTVIEGNHIHDNPGWPGGIYLDEGSGFIEVRNNKVYNVPTPMNFNNRNQNRIDTCNVHDNDFEEKKQ